jgi:hypothetical protein
MFITITGNPNELFQIKRRDLLGFVGIAVLNKSRYVIRVVPLTAQGSMYTSSLREPP